MFPSVCCYTACTTYLQNAKVRKVAIGDLFLLGSLDGGFDASEKVVDALVALDYLLTRLHHAARGGDAVEHCIAHVLLFLIALTLAVDVIKLQDETVTIRQILLSVLVLRTVVKKQGSTVLYVHKRHRHFFKKKLFS